MISDPKNHIPESIFENPGDSPNSEEFENACWEQGIYPYTIINAKDLVVKARTQLVLDRPFFGRLAMKLDFQVDVGMDTCWVDGKVFGYNPKFISECTVGQIKTIVAHEVLHCAMGHHCTHRKGERNNHYWNQAGDYIVNHVLKKANFEWLEGLFYNDKYGDSYSIEQIYKEIAIDTPPPPPDKPKDDEDGDQPDKNKEKGDGNAKPKEPPTGAVRSDESKSSPAESKEDEQEWQIATSQAANQAKAMGKMSAAEERFFKELLPNPKMDWREVLKQFMQSYIKNDYSFVPPNKRFIWMDLILPSLRGEALGEIVIAIDTSASLSEHELSCFGKEVNEALETCVPEKVHIVYCDSSVCTTEEYTPDQYPINFKPVGGGGTRFTPVYDWVKRQGIDPLCLLYFTDMYCSDYPRYSPQYPSLFVSTTDWGTDGCPYGPPAHMNSELAHFEINS